MNWTALCWLVALVTLAAVGRTHVTPTPSVGTALPAAGEWTLTLNPTARAICVSRRSFQLPSARIFHPTAYTNALVLMDGDSFRFRDDVYARIPGTTNRFGGTITLADATRATLQFALVTPTQMTGQIVAGYRVDTTACTETVLITFEQAAQP